MVAALFDYIRLRPRAFPADVMFWLPASQNQSIGPYDSIYSDFSEILMKVGKCNPFEENDDDFVLRWRRIANAMANKNVYVVIDSKRLPSKNASIAVLEHFLQSLLHHTTTNVMKIILIEREERTKSREPLHARQGVDFEIPTLDFQHAAELFAAHAPHSLKNRHEILRSPREFASRVTPPEWLLTQTWFPERYSELWTCLGEGVPSVIRITAMDLVEEDLQKILKWWSLIPALPELSLDASW